MKLIKLLPLLLASLFLCLPSQAQVQPASGFLADAYKATFILYGSSVSTDVTDRAICTLTAFEKVKGGYDLLSAGHCTSLNTADGLPADLTYSVAEDIGKPLMPVTLVAARLQGSVDYSIFYLPTSNDYPVIPLGDESTMKVGDETISVNFSRSIAKEYSPGIIVSIGIIKIEDEPDWIPGLFEVQQFETNGASGSSVIDAKSHKIIGIVIGGEAGVSPAFVEPISFIKNDLAASKHSAENAVAINPNPKSYTCAEIVAITKKFEGHDLSAAEDRFGKPGSILYGAQGHADENAYAYDFLFTNDGVPYFIEFEFLTDLKGKILVAQEDACGANNSLVAPFFK